MNEIRQYLFRIICLCIFISILCAVLPDGWKKKHLNRVCSIALILLLLSPILRLDAEQISSAISSVFLDTEQARIGFELENTSILEQIVRQKAEDCILEKANQLGMDLEVRVTAEFRDNVPFPAAAEIKGTYSEDQKRLLTVYLERELGIPEEHMTWIP